MGSYLELLSIPGVDSCRWPRFVGRDVKTALVSPSLDYLPDSKPTFPSPPWALTRAFLVCLKLMCFSFPRGMSMRSCRRTNCRALVLTLTGSTPPEYSSSADARHVPSETSDEMGYSRRWVMSVPRVARPLLNSRDNILVLSLMRVLGGGHGDKMSIRRRVLGCPRTGVFPPQKSTSAPAYSSVVSCRHIRLTSKSLLFF